jgi:hypothetical protein
VEEEPVSVPGKPRPVPHPPGGARPAPAPAGTGAAATQESTARPAASPFADLAGRPVAEHVAVFEAEHERLQRELSTIDQL